jgi:hypothetical protein
LSYELWRSSAMLRIIAKGAPLIVTSSNEYVIDARTHELNTLVHSFDERLTKIGNGNVSATGIVFESHYSSEQGENFFWLPNYNLKGITTDDLKDFFINNFNIKFKNSTEFNFVWSPFNLKNYRKTHLPFNESFQNKYEVKLDAVLLAIGSLCIRVNSICNSSKGNSIVRYWQRAYEGPYLNNDVFDEILRFLPVTKKSLGRKIEDISQEDIYSAFQFLSLKDAKRDEIDLVFPGPHYMFLPYGNDRIFIDYAWIFKRLYSLFYALNLKDQSFKGSFLEDFVRRGQSVLPSKQCRAVNGETKQIDAAFGVGKRLVINPSCYHTKKLMEQARTKRATLISKPLAVTA